MKISDNLKRFIEDNKELINNNNFKELYDKLPYKTYSIRIYEYYKLAEILQAAHVNPIAYTDSIPQYFYAYNKDITSYIVPKNVKVIDSEAFSNCIRLSDIVFAASVEVLGIGCFADCISLTHVKLPDNLQAIMYGAFQGCINLSEVVINNRLKQIDSQAFGSCTSLKSIVIPRNVKAIATDAFQACDLQDVKYMGTTEEWDKIERPGGYAIGTVKEDTVIHCIDGDIVRVL